MALADEPAPDAIADEDDDAMGDDAMGDDAMGDDEEAAGVVDEEDELQAAAPTARLAAMPDMASRRTFFTGFSLFGVFFGISVGIGPGRRVR
jgi:hypothetical protein